MAIDKTKYLKDLLGLQEELNRSLNSSKMFGEKIKIQEELIANQKKIQLENENLINNSKTKKLDLSDEEKKQLKEIIEDEKKHTKEIESQTKSRQKHVDLIKQFAGQLKIGWKYLQEQDKIIKSTNLNLGMASSKAIAMRDSFEKSAGYVIRLGGSIADIQTIMQGYGDETGRARALTANMVEDIVAIGKGTGLGVEQAARLGAQFELMGFSAKGTMNFVQGVVDTSERMGVNTTKVLKNINDNFKKLNTYTFQEGSKGIAKMATYAEKFKIDIGQALNAADVARSLDGAINLAAQLQIMGGEFAKTDPFQMLFLSRNDPAKFSEKIADMTKGIVTFRKMADGSFEKFISPADRDRLAAVAKSLGMEAGALTEMAQRQAEIQKMRKEMAGTGLSDKQKEIIEGAATFDQKSGKFQVQIGQTMTNISELTKDQAKAFEIQTVSLKERAKQAMTFDETFKATIEILKSSLLPLLKTINKIAENTIVPIANWAASGGWGLVGAGATLLVAATAWKGLLILFDKISARYVAGVQNIIGGGKAKNLVSGGDTGAAGGNSSKWWQTKAGGVRKGAAGVMKAQGLKNLGTGAGVGIAAAGVGAGIMVAAKGIGSLAQSIKDVDLDKLKVMNGSLAILGGTMIAILAPAVIVLGTAGEYAALGLLAFGAAALMVGAGIGIAAYGVGKMSEGIAKMNMSGTGAGKQLLGVASGIVAISTAMYSGGLLGMLTFNNSLSRMANKSTDIEKIGIAFANIKSVLSGTKDDFIAVQNAIDSISKSKISGAGIFADLANLLSKPIEVKFANNGELSLKNDITLEVDRNVFMHKIYDAKIAVQLENGLRFGNPA